MNFFALFKKEFKSYFNSPIAYIVIVAYLLICGWFFTSRLFLVNQAEIRGFFEITPLIFVFFAPAITMKLIAEEKKSGTIELLATLPLKGRDIILGKYIAALALLTIAVLLTFIYPLTVSMLGNIDTGQTVAGYIGVICMGGLFLSIGLFASSITSNQIVAFILSFTFSFGLFMCGKILHFVPEFLVSFIEFISIDYHFENIARGVLDSRDIFYYISGILLFFMLAEYFLKSRKRKTHSLAALTCSIGIIVLLNFISVRKFFRLDFTEDSVYTLSQASKKIMKELDDPLIIKAYFTKNLPPPYNSNVRYLKDQLDEFKAYSRGKLKYEFIDPGNDKELERELMMMRIPPVQLTNIRSDKFEIKKGYMAIAIMFEDRKEVIPVVQSTVGLEYDIISRIKKIIKKDTKTIGFLTGHGEPDMHEEMGTAVRLLREQYDVRQVDLNGGKSPVPDTLDALVIAGPKEKISEREKYEIDLFLMKGKTIAFLLDMTQVDLRTFNVSPVTHNLDDLVKHYGIKVNNDLVLDYKNKRIQVQQKMGYAYINNIINYPLIPVFTDMNKENSMVMKIETVFFPFVSSLDIEEDKKGKTTATPLIRSSRRSWKQTGRSFNTNPLQRFRMDSRNAGPFIAAAVASGEFTSFYAGKDIPAKEKDDGAGSTLTAADEKETRIDSSPTTRIVVIGDSDFIKDAMLMDNSNTPFIMNMMDWLAQDEALISIRSRGIYDRPFGEISDFKRKLVKYLNMFGVSAIVIIFGLIRWKIRQFKKREIWV